MSARDTILTALRRAQSAGIVDTSRTPADMLDAHCDQVLRAGAALVEDHACDADFTEDPRFIAGLRAAAELLTRAAGQQPYGSEVITVSRYNTAMEPAPEEEPLFAIGAIDEDGRPVALLFDVETRRKVAGWLAPNEVGEKSSRAAADATSGPTGRVAQLLDAIRTARGRWTTVTAFRFYRDHLRSLDHIPNTQLRAVARGDLRDLAAWGHLLRFEEPGRQYYTLKTRKDGA